MTSRVSTVITDQIRQASDIVDVVSSYVALRRAGTTFKGLCPFHREKTASFSVNPQLQIFKCFGCGAGGDVFKFIQLKEGVNFPEAKAVLAARAGINIPDDSSHAVEAPGKSSKVDLERVNRWAGKWFQQQLASPMGHAARQYLERRGVTLASVEKYELGLAPDGWDSLLRAARAKQIPTQLLVNAGLIKENAGAAGTQIPQYDAFRNRVIFPIKDVIGRVIGFGGRALGDDPAKYLNTPQTALFEKSRSLYGLSFAKDAFREKPVAIVVEGYMDCLIAQQHGFLNTIATLGTALTTEHVRLLRRYVDTVILVFDSDAAGQKAADRALEIFLSEQIDVRVSAGSEAKDPADLLLAHGPQAFERVLTSASEALEFKWKQVLSRYRNDQTGPERRRAVEEFLRLIAQAPALNHQEPIQRGLILNQVAKLLGLSSTEVHRQLGIVARRVTAPASSNEPRVAEDAAGTVRDAAAKAMADLVGVLLNEPSYYASLTSVFDPAWIADPVTRKIAEELVKVLEEEPSFSVAELIGRFDSVDMASRITSLQAEAEERGNYAATIEGAVQCLNRARAEQKLGRLETTLRLARGSDATSPETLTDASTEKPEDELAAAQAYQQARKQVPHFAAPGHLAHVPQPNGASEAAHAGPTEKRR